MDDDRQGQQEAADQGGGDEEGECHEALPGHHAQRKRARTSGLTIFSAGHSPRLRETTASAAERAMSSRDCRSPPAAWGVSTTLSSSSSGFLGGGSSSNTS